jgi:hypothetical protein
MSIKIPSRPVTYAELLSILLALAALAAGAFYHQAGQFGALRSELSEQDERFRADATQGWDILRQEIADDAKLMQDGVLKMMTSIDSRLDAMSGRIDQLHLARYDVLTTWLDEQLFVRGQAGLCQPAPTATKP